MLLRITNLCENCDDREIYPFECMKGAEKIISRARIYYYVRGVEISGYIFFANLPRNSISL